MNNHISRRDLDTISAYLDDQLSSRARGRLEKRLQSDRRLQEALEDLKNTRRLLRQLPRLRSPRNFTLTPEMAGIKPRPATPRFAPALSWASALATLMLVAVLLGDAFGVFGPSLMGAPAIPVAKSEPVVVTQEVQALEMQEGEAVAESAAEPAAAEELSEMAAPAEDEPPVMESERVGVEGTSVPEQALSQIPATVESLGDLAVEQGQTITPSVQVLVPYPAPTPFPSPEAGLLSEAAAPDEEITREVSGLSILRIFELALAVLAVTTGSAAVYLHRRARR